MKWKVIKLLGLMMVGLGVGGWWLGGGRENWSRDFRMIVLSPKELGLVSVSPRRQMVNVVKVDAGVRVWIPGGLGWYSVDQLAKIVDQEKKESIVIDLAFYNFGFLSNRVLRVSEFGDWDGSLMSRVGWGRWWWYKLVSVEMLPKVESLMGEKIDEEMMEKLAVRDLSDSLLAEEDMRLVVVNASQQVGLANFVAKRLTWSGLMVTDVDADEEIKVDRCLLQIPDWLRNSAGVEMVRLRLGCRQEVIDDNSDEVELYLGDALAEMLNYSSLKD